MRKAHNSKLKIQNSKLPKAIIQNSKLKTHIMDNSKELFPLVDNDGNVIGSILRGEAHNGSKKLHPVVHLHVINSKGELYLQKRPEWKDIQPGKWDTACGGHVDYGENVAEALRREVGEELGIKDFTPTFITHYIFESNREKEFVNVFAAHYDGSIHPSESELDGGRFWSAEEIACNLGKDVFTPNFESEYKKVVEPYIQSEKTHTNEQ